MVDDGFITEFTDFTDTLPEILEAYCLTNISTENEEFFDLQAPNKVKRLQNELRIPFPLGWQELDDFFDESNQGGKCSVHQDSITNFWTSFASSTRKYVKTQQKYQSSKLEYFQKINLSVMDAQGVSDHISSWLEDDSGQITPQKIFKDLDIIQTDLAIGKPQDTDKEYFKVLVDLDKEFEDLVV